MNVDEVVEAIMDGILYEECDVAVPRHLHYLIVFSMYVNNLTFLVIGVWKNVPY